MTFDFEMASDGTTPISKGIPLLITQFEEFLLRINTLKTNPHIKNFFDKLLEIERTVKGSIEVLGDWSQFQRNWMYLSGIFSKAEISRQLQGELKQFGNLDNAFKNISRSINNQP